MRVRLRVRLRGKGRNNRGLGYCHYNELAWSLMWRYCKNKKKNTAVQKTIESLNQERGRKKTRGKKEEKEENKKIKSYKTKQHNKKTKNITRGTNSDKKKIQGGN